MALLVFAALTAFFDAPLFHDAADEYVRRLAARGASPREGAEYLPLTGRHAVRHFGRIERLLQSADVLDRAAGIVAARDCFPTIRRQLADSLPAGRLPEFCQEWILNSITQDPQADVRELAGVLTACFEGRGPQSVRTQAASALAHRCPDAARDVLRRRAEDAAAPAWLRRAAVNAFPAMTEFSRELPWLCRLLDAPDPELRDAAENTVMWAVSEVTLPYLMDQFREHPGRRGAILTAIARSRFSAGGGRLREAAIGSLASPATPERVAAVRLVRRACGPTAESWLLLGAMQLDPVAEVRGWARGQSSEAGWGDGVGRSAETVFGTIRPLLGRE